MALYTLMVEDALELSGSLRAVVEFEIGESAQEIRSESRSVRAVAQFVWTNRFERSNGIGGLIFLQILPGFRHGEHDELQVAILGKVAMQAGHQRVGLRSLSGHRENCRGKSTNFAGIRQRKGLTGLALGVLRISEKIIISSFDVEERGGKILDARIQKICPRDCSQIRRPACTLPSSSCPDALNKSAKASSGVPRDRSIRWS